MDKNLLLKELERLIKKYIDDEEYCNLLIKKISITNIKGILAMVDEKKNKNYTIEDLEIIKDIYYFFC